MKKDPIIARTVALGAVLVVGASALAYSLFGKGVESTSQADEGTSPITITNTPEGQNQIQATRTEAARPENTQSAPPSSSQTSSSGAGTASSQEFNDGTYTAVGNYISPGGDEKISVTVTLKDDIITTASVVPGPVDSEARRFQGIFAANFEPLVVGKDISGVHLSEVSGSSLTSGGFNQALAEIEAQAKA